MSRNETEHRVCPGVSKTAMVLPARQFYLVAFADAPDAFGLGKNKVRGIMQDRFEFLVQIVYKPDGFVIFQDLLGPVGSHDGKPEFFLEIGACPGMVIMGMGEQDQVDLFSAQKRQQFFFDLPGLGQNAAVDHQVLLAADHIQGEHRIMDRENVRPQIGERFPCHHDSQLNNSRPDLRPLASGRRS